MALFKKAVDGDDALLHLAGLRFREVGLGPEFNADTPMELEWLLRFKPAAQARAVVHLSRDIDLLDKEGQMLVMDFAQRFNDQIFGLVVHDQVEIATRLDDYLSALGKIESGLSETKASPYLFIEYTAGLEPELFVKLFKEIRDLRLVTGCVDIGHIGLWKARKAYFGRHPGKDVCAITPWDPELPEVIEDVEDAVRSALGTVLDVIGAFAHVGKAVHFHLHDAHPLSTLSPYGVSDHLSFLDEVPIPFEYKGKKSIPLMFGPYGLAKIVTESLLLLGPERVSFSLEIHPAEGRLPLGDAAHLFGHWQDKTNAERMNHWLWIILRNHALLSEACTRTLIERKSRMPQVQGVEGEAVVSYCEPLTTLVARSRPKRGDGVPSAFPKGKQMKIQKKNHNPVIEEMQKSK
jgi:hypothetical protein